VDAARHAEQAGYDSVWVGDSLLARPRGEPLTLLAAISSVTSRVTLGTAVLLPLLRHPITQAHAIATLDRLCGGRLILGVGPAADLPGTHAELAAIGVPSDRRVTTMMAIIDRMRRLWRDEEPDLHLLPRPEQPGGPPFWLGAHGPRMLRLAGTRFEGWIPFSPTPDEYRRGLSAVREAAAEAGRKDDVSPAVYLTLAVAGDPHQAARDFDAYIRAYYGVPGEVMARAQASHAGTLESAAEWIASYVDAGARHVVLRFARPTLDGYSDTVHRLLEAVRRT
jgi:alkanesulfonate monooxygenase SsuD/methylene tetrahydromethanopterin reductase-like flavin-dependent oxidoreductase (luciferase family)